MTKYADNNENACFVIVSEANNLVFRSQIAIQKQDASLRSA
jgi:hypothetical protein